MTEERFSRTARLLGDAAMEQLFGATVLLFGLGGVGGAAFEMLVRAGVGHIVIVDGDAVSISNINRQLIADDTSIGMRKTDAARTRAGKISPHTRIDCVDRFVTAENADETIAAAAPDVILDAIDNTTAKVAIAVSAAGRGIPLLSCMSTGNKLDPTKLQISDLQKTHTCPLCRVMRRALNARGLSHLTVVWSDEAPITPTDTPTENGRHIPASAPFVPPVAGILMARWALDTILSGRKQA